MNQISNRDILPPDEKAEVSRKLIRDALSGAKRPAIGFSGGKKSVVLLYLARQEYALPMKVFYVRTADEFENIAQFIEKLKKLWKLDLTVCSSENDDAAADLDLCCRPTVAAALRHLAQTHAIDCLLLGNAFEDLRQVKPSDESGISCINPIFHFSDSDIQNFIEKNKTPLCSLYDDGYEKLDCKRCTPAPAARPPAATAADEERLIKEKLKRLGYL